MTKAWFKISVLFGLLFCIVQFMYAQEEVIVIPDEITIKETGVTCTLCKPGIQNKTRSRGVELAYGLHLSPSVLGQFAKDEDAVDNVFYTLGLKATIPVVNKPNFKFLVGVKYNREKQIIEGLTATNEITTYLNDNFLNSYAFNLTAVKPLNARMYTAFRAQTGFAGDIQKFGINKRYINFNILGTFGVKASEDFEYGFGLVYSRSYKNDLEYPIPIVIINKNFTSKFGIETVLPSHVRIRYNINTQNLLVLATSYESRSYHLKRLRTELNNTNETVVLDYASILIKLGLEKQVKGWLWCGVEAGYIHQLSGELYTRKSEEIILNNDLRNQPYLNFSLFLSPPKEFIK